MYKDRMGRAGLKIVSLKNNLEPGGDRDSVGRLGKGLG